MTQAASLDTAAEIVESPALEAVPDAPAEEAAQDNVDESQYIRIPKGELYPALGKLVEEDAEFGQAVRTITGSRQKREYEAQIETLRAEKAALEHRLNTARFEVIEADPEALAEKLRDDPKFRQEYSQYKSSQPPRLPDPQAQAYRDTVFDQLDRLSMSGLAPQRDALEAAIRAGRFNADASGRPLTLPQQLVALTSAVDQEIAKARTPSAPEEPQANAKLATGNPDMARGSRNGGTKTNLAAVIGDIEQPLSVRRRAYEQEHGIKAPF